MQSEINNRSGLLSILVCYSREILQQIFINVFCHFPLSSCHFRDNVQWYAASVRIQKMILFLLQRGSKAFHLNFGGLFIGSMETAAMVKEYTLQK
jgi:hypothetical protein